MPAIHRALLGAIFALLLLAGCNFDVVSTGNTVATVGSAGSGPTVGSGGGSSAPIGFSDGGGPSPPAHPVNATPSLAGPVSVMVGASQTISVAFTSADGTPISGLALSNTNLPPGWSGPSNFSCSVTGSGNSCVLTLTYSPTAVGSGTLTIGYVYAGDQVAPPGVSLSIPYTATASDNVVATATPIGQINAASGTGNQSVSVNFTTDDGNAATGLTISNLSALPTGWSTTTSGFSCAIISNGNGCQLLLNYKPMVTGSGTLTLSYGYTNAAGLAGTGTLNLPYAATANGNVAASVSPAGQINAVENAGTQAIGISFNTDNGETAQNLVLLSPLASLPAGWGGPTGGFTCATVNTGNACQLVLSYAPTALTSGTVQLDYGYTSPSGAFTTGSVNIGYAATTNDNVVATAAPSGQIDAVVGAGTPSVAVTFTTDDTRTATDLQLTTDLTTLPAGWTSTDSTFSCAGVTTGATCELPLSYAPSAAASGTVTLRYTYQNNAGQPKSGSLNIPYRATTDDAIVGSANPGSLAVITGTSATATVTFATDDGNPASGLSVTSGLDVLPAGFSAGQTFACSSVSAGMGCQLALTYQPLDPDAGTLTLGFTYTNDSGDVKTGTVMIAYTATGP